MAGPVAGCIPDEPANFVSLYGVFHANFKRQMQANL